MRTRSNELFGRGRIVGTAYDKGLKRTTVNYNYYVEDRGASQIVTDVFPHGQAAVLARLEVPPVNPFYARKIEHVKPTCENISYVAEDSNARYSLIGVPFVAEAINRSYVDQFALPYNLSEMFVEENVASYLYQKALAKTSQAEYDFGITLGEIAETASFLAAPLSKLVSLSNHAFRGIKCIYSGKGKTYFQLHKNASKRTLRKLKAASQAVSLNHPGLRVADETASHWLAYKFGVLPILDDIKKGLEFRDKNVSRLLGARQVRVRSTPRDVTTSRVDSNSAFYQFRYDLFRVRREIDQHFFGLYFRNAVTGPLHSFLQGLGLGQYNLFTVAYETLPLSFVVDRFIDIKSFVRGNLGTLSKDILTYYCSRKKQTMISATATNIRFGYPLAIPCKTSQSITSNGSTSSITRVVNLDRPRFPVINPYWRDMITADMTNLSLIWGRLRTFVGKMMR